MGSVFEVVFDVLAVLALVFLVIMGYTRDREKYQDSLKKKGVQLVDPLMCLCLDVFKVIVNVPRRGTLLTLSRNVLAIDREEARRLAGVVFGPEAEVLEVEHLLKVNYTFPWWSERGVVLPMARVPG